MKHKPILSTAHEWVGNHSVECKRCGHESAVKDMRDAPRCVPHYESATSGYLDESKD